LCGIAGTFDEHALDDPYSDALLPMLESLGHRGPDGICAARVGHVALGHTRLAIMDPEGGAQPLLNRDNTRGIVVNGEIYNWRLLRAQTEEGYRFDTESDSEVLLPLFDEAGPAMAHDLDGMFAFAVADYDRLVLGRDPIGIKPIYMGRSGSGWRFASEMKALVGRVDQLELVPPGHVWDSVDGLSRFYRVPDPVSREDLSVDEHRHRLRSAVFDAVEKRLMSDVPLGAFLSGGLDSSIIAAIAAQELPGLPTFTVGIEGSPDVLAARQVAVHIGSDHHELTIAPADVRRELPEIVYHLESFDRDVVRSAIPTWFVARLAAERVKTVLTGEGADELLAGYAYYQQLPADRLSGELTDSVRRMHNVNLQRVDRMTMAHGLEARVPLLDTDVIAAAQQIPIGLKLRHGTTRPIEKWILRSAFEDLLPAAVVWRNKAQFDEGSGITDIVDDLTESAGAYHSPRVGTVHLRSTEEALYHRLFSDAFVDPAAMEPLVGRWIPDAA
jgi:asparagine synthase (glutamine-hydrolysing)